MQIVQRFLLLGLLGIVLGLAVNTLRPTGLSLVARELVETSAAGVDTLETAESPALAVIGFAEADVLFQKELAAFVDARDAEKFAAGHIPGAINLPTSAYRDGEADLPLPKGFLVVIYCDGGHCELSHELADLLVDDGYRKVRVYEGGYEEWDQLGMPLESGE